MMKEHELLDRIQYWQCRETRGQRNFPNLIEGEIYWVLIDNPTASHIQIRDEYCIRYGDNYPEYSLLKFDYYGISMLKNFTRIL